MSNTISELRAKLAILRGCRDLLLEEFGKDDELTTDTQNVLDALQCKIALNEKRLDRELHFACDALLSQHKMGLVTFEELVTAMQWDRLTASLLLTETGDGLGTQDHSKPEL